MSAEVDGPGVEPVQWTFDPWIEHRGRAATALLCALGLMLVAAGLRLPLPIVTALSLSVMALLAPGFLPTHCGVDSGGVSRRIGFLPASRRSWHSIRAAALTRRGLHVATREWQAPLAALQQMTLPMPAATADSSLGDRLRLALADHGY